MLLDFAIITHLFTTLIIHNFMQHYSIQEANHYFPNLLNLIERGETIGLTRQGKTIAVILSEREYQQLVHPQRSPWEALQAFRQAVNIEQLDLDTDIFTVNRQNDRGREIEL
jgi:antitoxin (DNA-binding transcriptional repressor) of toxin-antitoxin stability system